MRRRATAAGWVVAGWVAAGLLAASTASAQAQAVAEARSNVFNDPFVQVTAGLVGCPVPDGPGVTPQEARELAHDRAQRGVILSSVQTYRRDPLEPGQ